MADDEIGDIVFEHSLWIVSGTAHDDVTLGDMMYNDGTGWVPTDDSFTDGDPIAVAQESGENGDDISLLRSGAVVVGKETGDSIDDGTYVPIGTATAGYADGGESTYAGNAVMIRDAASDDENCRIYLL